MPLQKHVWEVMDSNFTTISSDTGIQESIEILTKTTEIDPSAQGLIIVDELNRFKGTLTFKDVISHMKGLFDASCKTQNDRGVLNIFSDRCRIDADKKVEELIKNRDVKVSPNDKLVDAMKKLMDDRVSMLPVIEGNRPVGVLYLRVVFLIMKELLKK